VFGIALGIENLTARTVARVAAFIPPVWAYVAMKPQSFGASVNAQLSTSQWIGLLTALLVSYFYAKFWVEARKQPKVAMGKASLGSWDEETATRSADEDEEDAEAQALGEDELTETKAEAPKPKKKRKKGLVPKDPSAAGAAPAEEDDAAEEEPVAPPGAAPET
jgi:phosphatidylglycerol:prolipoprotein diacylglycerol transferase